MAEARSSRTRGACREERRHARTAATAVRGRPRCTSRWRARMTPGAGDAAILRRSIQVTCSASIGFYTFLYGLQQPVAALYALFTPIALGLLSTIPGTGRQQAWITLRTLPFGVVFVALGTALAVSTAAAVAGMLIAGFLLSFTVVAGPRTAGPAPGLQLLDILACFPPYAPQTLGARLTGAAVGVVLLSLCQVFVLSGPPATSYRIVLADALETAAAAVVDPARVSVARLRDLSEGMCAEASPGQRPTGPALGTGPWHRREPRSAGSWTSWRRGARHPCTGATPRTDRSSAALRERVARTCEDTGAALRAGERPPTADALDKAIRQFQAERSAVRLTGHRRGHRRPAATGGGADTGRVDVDRGDGRGLAAGRRTSPLRPRELFWYADLPTAELWARRIVGNATHRSVWFQNAVRLRSASPSPVLSPAPSTSRTDSGAPRGPHPGAYHGRRHLAGRAPGHGRQPGGGCRGRCAAHRPRWHLDAYAVLLVPGMLIAFALLAPRLSESPTHKGCSRWWSPSPSPRSPRPAGDCRKPASSMSSPAVSSASCVGCSPGRRERGERYTAPWRACCARAGRWYPPRSRRCWPRRRPLRLRPRRCRRCGICVWRRPPTRSSAASHPPPGRAPRPTGTGAHRGVPHVLGAQRLPCFEAPLADVPPDARAWVRRDGRRADDGRRPHRHVLHHPPTPRTRPAAPLARRFRSTTRPCPHSSISKCG